MSLMYIRLDDCPMYNRAIMILYTRIARPALCKYLGEREFLAEDRQLTFFKIDVDVELAPARMKLHDWFALLLALLQFTAATSLKNCCMGFST